MVGGTHYDLNKIKYWRFLRKESGERNYGEACSNINMGLAHFDYFFGPDLAIYRMKMRQNVHRSAKWQPERNSHTLKLWTLNNDILIDM